MGGVGGRASGGMNPSSPPEEPADAQVDVMCHHCLMAGWFSKANNHKRSFDRHSNMQKPLNIYSDYSNHIEECE